MCLCLCSNYIFDNVIYLPALAGLFLVISQLQEIDDQILEMEGGREVFLEKQTGAIYLQVEPGFVSL